MLLSSRVFLDSCVLFGSRLTDVLLYMAANELYDPLWSERVLAAVERDVPKQRSRITPEMIARRTARMRSYFPEAMVTGYEHQEPKMRNHPGDRHVLAAAVHGGADVLVTNNTQHFPLAEMERHHIVRMTADEFLLDLLDEDPGATVASVDRAIMARKRPPEAVADFLEGLDLAGAPGFAAKIRPHLIP